ncbi:MAG: nucleotidyltransferase, partial [Alistipes sp.]|nr:nucleotidyltransferase [Alistipes sp.]
ADAYKTMGDYLRSVAGQQNRYCMVGYEIRNTLSEYGAVSRGVCSVDGNGNLISMVERTKIERRNGRIVFLDENEQETPLAEDTPVSMNMFGFTPDYFKYSEEYFTEYLAQNINHPKSEFYIPTMVNKLVGEGKAQLRVLHSAAQWFGVTYKEDRPAVVERIRKQIEAGIYPENLWNR